MHPVEDLCHDENERNDELINVKQQIYIIISKRIGIGNCPLTFIVSSLGNRGSASVKPTASLESGYWGGGGGDPSVRDGGDGVEGGPRSIQGYKEGHVGTVNWGTPAAILHRRWSCRFGWDRFGSIEPERFDQMGGVTPRRFAM